MQRYGHDEPMARQGFMNGKLRESLKVAARRLPAMIVHDQGESLLRNRIRALNCAKWRAQPIQFRARRSTRAERITLINGRIHGVCGVGIGVGQRRIEDLNSGDPPRAHHRAKRSHPDVVRASPIWSVRLSRRCRGGGDENCGEYGQSLHATPQSHGLLLEV
jgi:hypothetical protein